MISLCNLKHCVYLISQEGWLVHSSNSFNLSVCSPKSIVLVVYGMTPFTVFLQQYEALPTIMALQVLKMF